MFPLEISVETISTGKVNSLREEAISENTFFPGLSSRSISFITHNWKTKTKLIYSMENFDIKTLSHNTQTNK
ncbi:MAG: hypothetical protein QXX32_06160 [Thermofilum sp.]|uniref:Uncharacterized protein n=1 Tax=Thermofilum adornatum TaxID=1365176 RepID=S5ZU32_9CREN|nr:hypothetical protein [Thermofilum adornatum]AGT34424.1 hypothetical protein N186_00130 [Thermofilum adornatum]